MPVISHSILHKKKKTSWIQDKVYACRQKLNINNPTFLSDQFTFSRLKIYQKHHLNWSILLFNIDIKGYKNKSINVLFMVKWEHLGLSKGVWEMKQKNCTDLSK